jgi:hypothetical protein
MPNPDLLVSVTERIFFAEDEMAGRLKVRTVQRGIVKAAKRWLETIQRYDIKTNNAPAGTPRKAQLTILEDPDFDLETAAANLITRFNDLLAHVP